MSQKYKHKYIVKFFDRELMEFYDKAEFEKFYKENKSEIRSVDVIAWET